MAIAYKGYSSALITATGNATMNIGSPQDGAAPAVGDFVAVVYCHSSPAGTIIDRGSLISSGYNNVTSNMWQDGSNTGINVRIFQKFFASAETSLVVPGVLATPDKAMAWAIWFSGVDPSTPFDVASTFTGGASSQPDPPAITPVNTGAVLLGFACGGGNGSMNTYSWPSPYTWSRSNSPSNTGRNVRSEIARGPWPGGTVNVSLGGASPNSWIAGTMALREAGLVTGKPKVWNGTAWVAKPLKVWNGSAWVTKPLKVWNGIAWVFPKET